MPSNDFAYVVDRSKTLENRLKDELNANGRGLRSLAGSVREKLPPETYQLLLKVADERDPIIHEKKHDKLVNEPEFTRWCDEIEASLNGLKKPERVSILNLGCGCVTFLCICYFLTYLFAQRP